MTSSSVTFDIIGRDRSGSAAFNKVANSANRADGAMSKFSAGAMKVVKAGALASVAVGGLAVKLGFDAVKAASDLNETLSKSQVIFGKHADGMEAWAGRADQSMGLSQQAALAAAASFGDMFSQIGFSGDQAVKMSKGVVQLSADLGSFNNLETADVAERMSAAFRGEYDSLQALIPNINAARVQTEALRMTGKKSAEQLTAQEKAAATLAIVTKDGARAQGDFARTSDGLANQTKILKAQLDNASASFGQKLLPMAVDLANFANKELVPAIEKGADWIGDRLPVAIDAAVQAGKDLRKAVAPAVEEVVEALGNLADEGDSAGQLFTGVFIPALRETAEVVGEVVNFVDNLPGPVKEFGAQAAIAALALSKLNGAMLAIKESQFVTTMSTAEGRTAKFAAAAKAAAGVGGILALAHGMSETDEKTKALLTTAGGIATGFAVGGPVGGAIGGLTGLVIGLKDSFSGAKEKADLLARQQANTAALEAYREGIDALSDTMDELSGSYTAATRAAALKTLQDEELVNNFDAVGLSVRDGIDAMLGNERAMRKVAKADENLADILGYLSGHFRQQRREVRENADAVFSLGKRLGVTGKQLKAIPRDVRIKIRDDVPDSLREIKKLARESEKLDRKTIRILLKAADLPVTKKNIVAIQEEIGKTDKKQANPKIKADDQEFVSKRKRILAELAELDRKQVNPKTDLSLDEYYRKRATLISSLNTIPDEYVNIWVTRRETGGNNGSNGTRADRTLPRVVGERSVAPVIDIMRKTAEKRGRAFQGIGAGIVKGLIRGLNSGNANQAQNAVDRMMNAIKKAVDDKKITEAAAKRMRATIRAMEREAEQGRSAITKRLEFANTLKESFKSELDLGSIIESEDFAGIGSITGGAQSLAARLQAFAVQLRELKQEGIPRALIGEIASLGSIKGSAAAAAILSGSDAEQQSLAAAFNAYQSAAGFASNTAANAVHGTVRDIKQEFHVTVNLHAKATREDGRELEQALAKWARDQGRALNFPVS